MPPAQSIRPPGAADFAVLALLALFWGSSFVFIKIAVETVPPLTLAIARMSIGAVILLGIARMRGQGWPRGRALWLRLIYLGVIGNSLPFFLIGWGEQSTPSNLAAILMAAVPIFVMILAHFFTVDEKLSFGKLLGVSLGFAGVVVLIGLDALKDLGSAVGQLAILGGTVSYSLYGITARKLPALGSEMVVGAILLSGVIAMAPVWLVVDTPWHIEPSWHSIGAVMWLGILSTALGNLLFFVLMRRIGASFASFNNYLVPLLGLVWGYALLDEEPGWNALAALVLILAGLASARFLHRPA